MDKMFLPQKILEIEQNKPHTESHIGMSGAEVWVYDEFVLKIQQHSPQSVNEAEFLRFLQGKSLAPKLLAYETQHSYDFLLMSKLQGKMLCDETFLENQRRLFEIASSVLHTLRGIPAQDCPCDMRLDKMLRFAEDNVVFNGADIKALNPSTFGKNGRFATPESLLQWLCDNKPSEDLVVTHGDFCLPNIFVCDDGVRLIDFPYGGVADRYCDIALLYRSIKGNLQGAYGGKRYADFDEKLFFDVLGIAPDYDKIEYYMLLDKLL